MTDLGDLIGLAPLGEQPATITVDVYARALAEIHSARQEIERLRQDLGHARMRAITLAVQLREARAEIKRLRADQEKPMSDTKAAELPDGSVVANDKHAFIKTHPSSYAEWRGTTGGWYRDEQIDDEIIAGAVVLRKDYSR